MAEALRALGLPHGFVVHGSDGMDEVTLTGPTKIWSMTGEEFELTPEDFGVEQASLSELRKDPVSTAKAVLAGEKGPARDIVLINASAALVAASKAEDWKEGVALATRSIDSGAAQARLEALRAI